MKLRDKYYKVDQAIDLLKEADCKNTSAYHALFDLRQTLFNKMRDEHNKSSNIVQMQFYFEGGSKFGPARWVDCTEGRDYSNMQTRIKPND